MKNILLSAALLFYLAGEAQNAVIEKKDAASSSKKLSFHSINLAGISEGENGSSFQIQSINGFAKNYWFAGVGVGIDHYYLRTIPLFLDVRKNILNKDKSPFLYADAGLSMPWPKKSSDDVWYKGDYKNGNYYDLGLGYNLPINKVGDFILSVGYSEKKLKEERFTYNYLIFSGIYNGSTVNTSEYNYRLRRISIKAGWRF